MSFKCFLSRLNILVTYDFLSIGGPLSLLSNYQLYLKDYKVKVRYLIALDSSRKIYPSLSDFINQSKATIIHLGDFPHLILLQFFVKFYTKVNSIFKNSPPNVILAHEFYSALFPLFHNWRKNPLLIFYFHGDIAEERRSRYRRRFFSWLLRGFVRYVFDKFIVLLVLNKYDYILCLSVYSRDYLTCYYGVPLQKIQIIPGGVDTDFFKPLTKIAEKNALRRRLKIPVGKNILLMITRLEERKNIIGTVESLSLLNNDYFLILMFPEDNSANYINTELTRIIKRYKIENRLRLVPYRDDRQKLQFLQAGDLFLMTSLKLETFGITILEAFSTGLPVLGTSVGAIPELIGQLSSRLLVSPAPIVIAEGIKDFFSLGEDGRRRLATKARRITLRYTWGNSFSRFILFLKSLPELASKNNSSQ